MQPHLGWHEAWVDDPADSGIVDHVVNAIELLQRRRKLLSIELDAGLLTSYPH